MTKRMLLDASHPEETRVVVLSGNRLDEFDYETKDKKQLKGNIYLAKITRVEPSLQAAFVDYGGNRHGFLPFSEIHPDYYRLPIADREALIAEEEAAQRRQAEEDSEAGDEGANSQNGSGEPDETAEAAAEASKRRRSRRKSDGNDENGEGDDGGESEVEEVETATSVETLAGDDIEDAARRRAASLGRYKIQEVIKRRQVILVQVVKEERGNKGAALTTYLSLAGRYCVLMPNTNKGGGISRKIANAQDRKRLKGVLSELHIPDGMAVIVRTAGSNRSKVEIKRDYEYLLRLWDQIRSTTLQSTAPSLIYEEANLIKRAVRDLYTRDMDEIFVEGEEGYKAAKSFMKSLMPSHAKKVKKYDDPRVPIFHRYQVEGQLDNIHNPTVQLKSGGYIVMNQTEALVAIDVNSGKATKERHIEETALKTNLEAAEEVARQLKLRDLAGLIVIDFIDMDAARNNREVEQRLKEAMRQDRARIQLGRISPFGLLELSRQRLRPSLHETSTEVCHTCGGSGFVRSPDSTSLHVMRALEEEGIKRGGGEVLLTVPTGVALYVLNDKRDRLVEVEQRYGFRVRIDTDDRLVPPAYRLDRLTTAPAEERQAEVTSDTVEAPDESEFGEETPEEDGPTTKSDDSEKRRKRGRRGGRRKKQQVEGSEEQQEQAAAEQAVEEAETAADEAQSTQSDDEDDDEDQKNKRRRRRGKRGGRRRSRRRDGEDTASANSDDTSSDGEPTSDQAAAELETEPVQQNDVQEAASDADASAEETTPKPKRRRRKAAEARNASDSATEEAPASGETASDSVPSEEDAAPPPSKSRSRRKSTSSSNRNRRDKQAEAASEAEATDAGGSPSNADESAKADTTVAPASTDVPPTAPEGPSEAPTPSPTVEEGETIFGEAAEPSGGEELATQEKPKPRRRGWWQKLVN